MAMQAETVERFSGRAEAYERYRAQFPAALMERLEVLCGLRADDVVADIGAGTGMLAERFLKHGNPVIAVEPNDEMRERCERLAERYPGLRVIGASAEETTIANGSVDLIAVGRAFHWFDRPRALREFKRILKPQGWVVLVGSHWTGDGPAVEREYEEFLLTRCVDYHRVSDAVLTMDELHAMFARESVRVEALQVEEALTFEQLLGRTESLSVTPTRDDPRYGPMREALEAYFARHEQEGRVRRGMSYRLICGQLR